LKVFKDFTKVAFTNYLSQIIAAFISIILARWLGPTDFGVFSIGFYILIIFGLGFTGFDQSYIRFAVRFSEKEQEIFSTYSILKICFPLFVIILFALFCFVPLPSGWFSFSRILILYGLIGGLGMNLFTISLSLFQAREEFNSYNRIRLSYYLILLFLIFVGIQFDLKEIRYYLLIYLLPGIFLVSTFREGHFSVLKFRIEIVKKLFRFGKWLLFGHFIRLINLRMDFFWLSRYFKGEILGQYSAALRLVNIFVLLIGTFSVLLLPKASGIKTMKEIKEYWFINRFIMVFLLISWVIIYFFSPFMIRLFFGVQYIQAIPIFRMLLYSVIPLIFAVPMEALFLGLGKTLYLFIFFIIQSLSLVLTIPLLASRFGLEGIIYGRIISFFIPLIFYFFIYKIIRDRFITNQNT